MPKGTKESAKMAVTTVEEVKNAGIEPNTADQAQEPNATDQAALAEIEANAKRELSAKPWLTYKQAAQYTGYPESKIRTASKTSPIFKTEGAVDRRVIEGTDFTVSYLSVEAINAWVASLKSKGESGVTRVKAKGNKFAFFAQPDQVEEISAYLAGKGITLERAFKPSAKQAEASPATAEGASPEGGTSTQAEVTMADLFKPETVNA